MYASSNTFHVAVVGTGIVGRASALALARKGLSVALVGPQHAGGVLPPQGFDARIYTLTPSSQAFLQQLRVWQALDAARVEPLSGMRVMGDYANGVLDMNSYQAAVAQLGWVVEGAHLERVLKQAVLHTPAIQPFDGQCERIIWSSDASSKAHPQQLVLTNQQTIACELVVGADGAQSLVRELAQIPTHTHDYDQTALVANFSCERPHHGVAFQWFTEHGVIALLPLPQQHVSLVWSAPNPVAADLKGLAPEVLAQRLVSYLSQNGQYSLGALQCISQVHSFELSRMAAKPIAQASVALVGDSAHRIHPLAGQGLNLGLEDAAALAHAVSSRETYRTCGHERIMRRYVRERAEPLFAMVAVTDGLQRLFARPDPATQWVLNVGMQLVNANPVIKQWLAGQASGQHPRD